MQKDKGMKLILEFDEDAGILNSSLLITDDKNNIDKTYILDTLKIGGYDKLYVDESAIAELIEHADQAKEIVKIHLAKVIDASLVIDFDTKKIKAFLHIKPSYGGKNISEKDVFNSIKEAGICYGIQKKVIRNLIESGFGRACIAQGLAPICGKDARIEELIIDERKKEPFVDEKGVADYYHQYEFIIVDSGTPLIKKIEATNGKSGHNVCGEKVEPEHGKDIDFPCLGDGVEVSEKSDLLLISNKKGHPVITADEVRVDLILTLDNVGIRTGHVDFDGSIHIKGDVEEGMSVTAIGDITIDGSVHSANIKSDGEVIIQQGVTGDDRALNDSDHIDSYTTYIIAKKNITANFASLAKLEAKGSIHLTEYAMQCSLNSGNNIFIGKDKGVGLLVGGKSIAKNLIFCKTAGSEARVKTKITIGNEPQLHKLYRKVLESLEVHSIEIGSLKKILLKIVTISKQPSNLTNESVKIKIRKIKATIKSIQEEIKKLTNKSETLKKEIKISKAAKLEVKDTIHSGVSVNLNGKIKKN